MREIAAASDFDFIAVEPRRANSAMAKRGRGKKKQARAALAWLAALWRYSTPFFGAVALAALLAMIAVNAMYLQHGPHPAPLFGSTVKIEPPKPTPRPANIDSLLAERLPERAPAPATAGDGALSPPAAVALDPAPSPPAAAPPSVPAKKGHDAIGALIAGNGVISAPAPMKNLRSAQRALQKLGAPVKPDGANGAATRKAIEAFQRDNHLPVTGELNVRTRRVLSAKAGLPVE